MLVRSLLNKESTWEISRTTTSVYSHMAMCLRNSAMEVSTLFQRSRNFYDGRIRLGFLGQGHARKLAPQQIVHAPIAKTSADVRDLDDLVLQCLVLHIGCWRRPRIEPLAANLPAFQ